MAPPDVSATLMPVGTSRMRVVVAIVAALVAIAATCALGFWQLRRAAEKTALDQAWEAARNNPPSTIRNRSDVDSVAANVPRRVLVRGEFDNAHAWWLDNRPQGGRAGFIALVPMKIDGVSLPVLVMRGWAPRDPVDRARLPQARQLDGKVELEGLAIADVPRVYELGEPGTGPIRQNMGRNEAAAELGVAMAPFVIQQTSAFDDGLDRQWPAPASGVERNRGYAFQWFSLSALITVLLLVFGTRALRARSRMGRMA